jgi:predicted transcriptional regulator
MLLSINPEHVENILKGNKLFEFRKVKCREDVDSIVIYSTSPVMQVVAEAAVEAVLVDDVLKVWQMTKDHAGISYDFYQQYYEGKETAVAYKLGDVTAYDEPRSLADFGVSHAPQSFVYINAMA